MNIRDLSIRLKRIPEPSRRIRLLKAYQSEFLDELMTYAYDPFLKIKVHHKQLKYYRPTDGNFDIMDIPDEIKEFLWMSQIADDTDNRVFILNETAKNFIDLLDEPNRVMFKKILSQNLRLRLTYGQLREVFGEGIPILDTQKWNTKYSMSQIILDPCYATELLTGVKVWAICKKDKWLIINFTNKVEIVTCAAIKSDLRVLQELTGNTFFEGVITSDEWGGQPMSVKLANGNNPTLGEELGLTFYAYMAGDYKEVSNGDYSGLYMPKSGFKNVVPMEYEYMEDEYELQSYMEKKWATNPEYTAILRDSKVLYSVHKGYMMIADKDSYGKLKSGLGTITGYELRDNDLGLSVIDHLQFDYQGYKLTFYGSLPASVRLIENPELLVGKIFSFKYFEAVHGQFNNLTYVGIEEPYYNDVCA